MGVFVLLLGLLLGAVGLGLFSGGASASSSPAPLPPPTPVVIHPAGQPRGGPAPGAPSAAAAVSGASAVGPAPADGACEGGASGVFDRAQDRCRPATPPSGGRSRPPSQPASVAGVLPPPPPTPPAAPVAGTASGESFRPRIRDCTKHGCRAQVIPASYQGQHPSIQFRSGITVDNDGAWHAEAGRDSDYRGGTAYEYSDGSPLNASRVPFIVLPGGYRGARMGDIALLEYKDPRDPRAPVGRVWTVCGDIGPRGVFGEASLFASLAVGAGRMGKYDGATYTVFPGTGRGRFRSEAELLAFIAEKSVELAPFVPRPGA